MKKSQGASQDETTVAIKESFIAAAKKTFCSVALFPSISSGRIINIDNKSELTKCCFECTYSQRDLQRKETRKFDKFYNVNIEFGKGFVSSLNVAPFQSEKHNIVIESISNDSKRKAIMRKVTEKDVESFYLEVWSNDALEKSFNLTSLKKHGNVYGDATLSSLQWSNDRTKLLYIAEKKPKENSQGSEENSDVENGKSTNTKVELAITSEEKFLYKEDWGEQKTGLHHPTIVVFDVESDITEVIKDVPDHLSPGQCVWGPDDSIIFVGWWHVPYRLGLIYCENRRSAIFQLKSAEDENRCIQLSQDNCSVHSPRVSPDGSKMIYLERDAGGPHRGCERLMMYDFKSKSHPSTVYDIVDLASDSKIALFCHSLPQRCWLKSGQSVIMHTNFKTNKVLVLMDVVSGKVSQITHEDGSWTILDTMDDLILASFAAPNQPHSLRLGCLNRNMEVSWINLQQGSDIHKSLVADIKWEKFYVSTDSGDQMECLLVLPTTHNFGLKPPLIVWPHGGPHTVMTADFIIYQASFSNLGFAVLLVNYRGSTGFGEHPLRSVLGKVGKQDVADVQRAAESALQTGRFSKENVFILGGSHGGFLSAHLIGQFPDFYKACVLRNPVINLTSMVDVTDIPDWCYTEVGMTYADDTMLSVDKYAKMIESSPIFHVTKVKTPVLILIGGSDARVPPSQGRSFYRALKSMEKTVKMLWYPDDCHPISKVESEASAFISIVDWLFSYM